MSRIWGYVVEYSGLAALGRWTVSWRARRGGLFSSQHGELWQGLHIYRMPILTHREVCMSLKITVLSASEIKPHLPNYGFHRSRKSGWKSLENFLSKMELQSHTVIWGQILPSFPHKQSYLSRGEMLFGVAWLNSACRSNEVHAIHRDISLCWKYISCRQSMILRATESQSIASFYPLPPCIIPWHKRD